MQVNNSHIENEIALANLEPIHELLDRAKIDIRSSVINLASSPKLSHLLMFCKLGLRQCILYSQWGNENVLIDPEKPIER